jgi:RNA polymerase sigma factor (sigma-70 family)
VNRVAPDGEGLHVSDATSRPGEETPTMTARSTPGPARTRTAPAVPVDGDRPARGAGPDADVTDADLVTRLSARDTSALDVLYTRHGRAAFSLARRICADEGLAEDVVQEVFLLVWRHPERYDAARGTVAAWLMTMVHHRAVDAVRREATRRRHTVPPGEEGDEWLPPGPGADEAALDAVVAGHVREALGALPTEQREALTLAYFGGFTQREVASISGIPLGTVKSRMFTAVRTLRGLLEGRVDRGDGEGTS